MDCDLLYEIEIAMTTPIFSRLAEDPHKLQPKSS